jgi:hypothetical protein
MEAPSVGREGTTPPKPESLAVYAHVGDPTTKRRRARMKPIYAVIDKQERRP